MGVYDFRLSPSQYDPLNEPSPLGLRLRKSPSLLDLIQMRLSQESASKQSTHVKKEQGKGTTATDKIKASNFPASLLRIGAWEYASRYEGDLVAKCYFAKHKLVWEVLDGSLKNKIEFQWSDIMDIKADCSSDGSATLNVVLRRQPLFYRETNPQPRKHTLWQASMDFTGGEASLHRRHVLQCTQGLLAKHFEKLMHCDPRLNFLSQQPAIFLESPFFEPKISDIGEPNTCKSLGINVKNEECSGFYGLPGSASPGSPSSLKVGQEGSMSKFPRHLLCEISSHDSETENQMVVGNRSSTNREPEGLSSWGQIREQKQHPFKSVSDLTGCISGEETAQKSTDTSYDKQNESVLEEIEQCLLSDFQSTEASDEESVMSRVNSFCSLLQKEPSVQYMTPRAETCLGIPVHSETGKSGSKIEWEVSALKCEPSDDFVGWGQAPSMSRKDSLGDLLNLPRIASFPQFMFNLSDDFYSQTK